MEILARPTELEDRAGPSYWIDEAIWGHRLHDEQSPWLTFLEFLTVLLAEHNEGRALTEETFNSLSYRPQQQLRLRNILFNNPHVMAVKSETNSDDAAWALWLERMAESAGGVDKPNFLYLRDKFDSFDDFAAVLGFLRGSAIDGSSNKRWSSKFVFPFGPNSLYEDLNVKPSGSVSNDRRFFARTGELLYLMLCRSVHVETLRPLVIERFLENPAPYDGLARALQGEVQLTKAERGGAYLPCTSHPIFDRIASDWLSILNLPIPAYDAIPHLVTITGLNLILYQLDRGRDLLERAPIRLVCEIVSPKKSVVRDLSADSYHLNNVLPLQAIERYIRRTTESPNWQDALISDDPSQNAIDILKREFSWSDSDDNKQGATPQAILDELVIRATTRHKQHVGRMHMTWARAIGLASRRSSRRVRYAPTDRLLKTLVVSCVPERIEFRDFLELLHTRYGFIIGDGQAKSFVDEGVADQEAFSDNARRLEERLASLGLLKRLSDSCAYVENPYQREQTT